MAQFNPEVKDTQDPNFLGYSKVVNPPSPDKSTAMAIGVAGDALEIGVKLADNYVKKDIENQIYTNVDASRDEFRSSLQTMKDGLQQNGVIPGINDSLTGGFNPDGTQARIGPAAVPPALQTGLDKLDELQAARSAGSIKMNDTYLSQQYLSIAKNLRNQYPGYREYIDSKFKEITGQDPANSTISNLMQDVNALQSANKSQQDKVLSIGYQNLDIPGIMPYINAVKARLPGAEDNMLNFINRDQAIKHDFDARERSKKEQNWNKEDNLETAKSDFQSEYYQKAANIFNTPFAITGLNQPVTILKMMSDMREGKINPNAEQRGQLAERLDGMRQELYSYGQALYNSKDRSYAKTIKDAEWANKAIEQNLKMVDLARDGMRNDKFGIAFEPQRRLQAIKTDTEMGIIKEDTDKWLLNIASIRKYSGDTFANTVLEAAFLGDAKSKFKTILGNKAAAALVPNDIRKDGVIASMYDDIVDAKKKDIPAESGFYDSVVKNIKLINDPNIGFENKAALADYAFNPKNLHLLDQFKKDYRDPITNKIVPGKYSVFNQLTSASVTKSIHELKSDPTVGSRIWSNYTNWAETSFQRLYVNDIKTLSDLQNEGSISIHPKWDSDNHRWELVGDDNKPLKNRDHTRITQNFIDSANATVNRINSGISNLKNIYKLDNKDTNAMLIRMMQASGFNPEPGRVQGFPDEMMNAIQASRVSFDKLFEGTFLNQGAK